MIDYLFRFASEADAKADPVIGAYCTNGSWDASCCIPGVQVWQPSADATETVPGPGGAPIAVVTHHPIADASGNPYWYILIAKPAVEIDLFNAALLTTDRTAARQGQPFVLGSVLSLADLATYVLAPSFAGAAYPFGAPA